MLLEAVLRIHEALRVRAQHFPFRGDVTIVANHASIAHSNPLRCMDVAKVYLQAACAFSCHGLVISDGIEEMAPFNVGNP